MSEEIKDIVEILELVKEELENNDENTSAILDLKDLKALKNLYDLYQQEKNKVQALEKQHDYDMQMIDEVKGNAVKLANERDGIYNDYQDIGKEKLKLQEQLDEEKEKNKDLQKQLNGAFDRGFISKDKIKEKIKLYEEERDRADKNAYAEWGELNTWEWKNYIVEILKGLLKV